jgi:DNA processing protein
VPLADARTADLARWLRLTHTRGVGPGTVRRLLEAFGSPESVFAASGEPGAPQVARALRATDPRRDRAVERALRWADHPRHHLVTLGCDDYPVPLAQLSDAPAVLYAVGQRDVLRRPMVAVVGARNATAAGTDNARRFAVALSAAGWTVVSGLALGIDAAAHEGALDGGAGTVAVIGTGADRVYPARHRPLADRVADDGLVISELPLGTPPAPGLFPRRNRLIAGMSQGVLVIEAAPRSGSLITARLATDFGRDVFAIPGSIHSPLARGCHALIREGAVLVESIDHVLAELRRSSRAPARPSADASAATTGRAAVPDARPEPAADRDDDRVLAALGHEPVHPDTLAAHLRLSIAEIGARLVVLELAGRVERSPDGRVSQARGASP